uniref:Uncharacterized protein n=1 Tax=Leptospira santarosai serovar Arenal str. MAVJ 401 TaxID=1049976 RepID=M6JEF9_9LEPT|nr:hypothetical protein LEP1GSC063_0689 [Leptospira santarosai serovar Arenal str. MAVJ 401]
MSGIFFRTANRKMRLGKRIHVKSKRSQVLQIQCVRQFIFKKFGSRSLVLHRLNVRIGSFVFSLLDSLRKSSRILTFWDKPYD